MDFEKKDFYDINDLLNIVALLRDKDNGCDWDKVQTHQSIRQNFIEETYEAVDAIDKNDKELLQEELGDVLLQVLLHAQFEKEEGSFDFEQVVNGLAQKLVLRHPHVFKSEKLNGTQEILNKWEEIKNASHGHNTVSRTLNAVPAAFPALMYAQKIQKRIQAGKLPVPGRWQEIDNMIEILQKMKQIPEQQPLSRDDLAQLMFAAVDITRQNHMDAEEVLSLYSRQIVQIFNVFENLALQNGIVFDKIEPVKFEKLWQQAQELDKKE